MTAKARSDLIISTSLWALLQIVFIQAGAFVTTMYVTRMLSLNEYGLIPLINSMVLLLVVFLGLGLPASLARFLAGQKTRIGQRQLLVKTGIKVLPLIAVMGLALYLVYPFLAVMLNEPRLLALKWYFFAILCLEMIRVFVEKICHGTGTMKISASLSGWNAIAILCITVPAVWWSPTAAMVVAAKAVGMLIPSIRAILSIRRALSKTKEQDDIDRQALPRVREVAAYGFPLTIISLSAFGFIQMDIMLLTYLTDTSTVALYAVGVLLVMKLTDIARAMGFGVSPQYAKPDCEPAQRLRLYRSALKYVLVFSLPFAIFLATFAGDTLNLLFGSKYANAGPSLSMMCLYFLMATVLAISSPVLDFGGRAKIRAYAAFSGAAVNIGLNFLLIPRYGALGAAAATLCGYSLLFFVTLITVKTMLPGKLLSDVGLRRVFFVVTPAFVVLVVACKLYLDHGFYICMAAMAILYPLAIVKLGIVEKTEVDKVLSFVSRRKASRRG